MFEHKDNITKIVSENKAIFTDKLVYNEKLEGYKPGVFGATQQGGLRIPP